jgi:hypothetical protein
LAESVVRFSRSISAAAFLLPPVLAHGLLEYAAFDDSQGVFVIQALVGYRDQRHTRHRRFRRDRLGQREIGRSQHRAFTAQDHGHLHGVFQLADVSRPKAAAQVFDGLGQQELEGNLGAAPAQRRHPRLAEQFGLQQALGRRVAIRRHERRARRFPCPCRSRRRSEPWRGGCLPGE